MDNIKELQTIVDEIKEKINDDEYLKLNDLLKKEFETKETNLYKIKYTDLLMIHDDDELGPVGYEDIDRKTHFSYKININSHILRLPEEKYNNIKNVIIKKKSYHISCNEIDNNCLCTHDTLYGTNIEYIFCNSCVGCHNVISIEKL